MISKDYKQNKEQVLAIYDSFKKVCEKSEKKVSENIESFAQKIKNDVFKLMVLGEAKSGKSTFINAYLGKEVVPMDVRQCTSAIIEIKSGKEFKLKAKTAVGGESSISGYEKISNFLKTHATISDKYRTIPITTINNEILIKHKGRIPEHTIDSFIKEVTKDNIYNIDINEYNRLIKEYINENKNSWEKIITEIEIIYPLPKEMDGITLIDSPGVGAGGNVGIIAEKFIEKADAIIFVKYLKGQALESTTFMNFFRNNITNIERSCLFLVLNGKSDLQGSEYNSLMEQAIQMYGNDLKPEKIIGVDSKVQLFLNKCRELGTEESIDDFFEKLDETNEDFPPASNCWLKSMRTGGLSVFEKKMEEISNFNRIHTALEKFAHFSKYLQLRNFLTNLENEYKRYFGLYSSILNEAKKNVNDPEILEDRIKTKKKEIQDAYIKINEGIDDISKKFLDNINGEGIIVNEAEKMKNTYEKKLENFKNLPENKINNTTFNSMKIITFDAIDEAKKFRREIANKVIEECNQKLIQYTNDSSMIPADVYSPNFTEADFDTIDDEALKKSSGYNDIQSGITFKKTEKIPFHHLKEHVRLVANSISDRLNDEIIPAMIKNVVIYVQKCIEVYKEQLTLHKNELENEYQKLLDDQKNNNSIIANINDLERKIEIIKKESNSVSELKTELKNYVEEQ
ncbi:dynamin family protein [Fusobacterium pseudoperiodonticum]|uniref:Dynamin family protein n=1 Tax=Fusobacterium pseudoperiodonticum TaxID=2663009 RepID=A0A2D3NV04_9FUSO|nr:dynamin family protein [Fusobacterium pseudoperiodonticum]ATV59243.1 dynamin family protein [Fusobacterium pseudoperiodonticum]